MSVVQTSLYAYEVVRREGIVKTQAEVLHGIFGRFHPTPLANFDLERLTGWKCNVISARRNQLVKEGRIIHAGKKYNRNTGVWCNSYKKKEVI